MTFLRTLVLHCGALAVVACTATSMHAVGGDRSRGEHIAARECAGCHGIGVARGITIQGVFVPSFSEIAGRPSQTRERLEAFVQIPRHPMPGIPLQADELQHVVEYIISLRD